MTIYQTPVYNFKYMDDDEPLYSLAAISKAIAESLEQAMGNAQIPPGNPSLNDVLNRLNNLERRAAGRVTVGISNSAHGFVDITFPAGRFSVAPVVMATKQSDSAAKYVPYVMSVTANGCRIGLYAGDGTASTQSLVVGWTAVQMSANSATG
ncbi:hypothetical protein CVCC1112_2619 [Paenarthrobacter nicotinovorans]|uniref:hypothetical protein n=1 Tax=Paenarthrobacter nicotinovorans TaxID=29320 RepID=UPI0007CC4FA9|nr:hypothetical protein [Paenarthrobacter nicotinovorans]GAT87960.1 hypothetical protein CVCC1112_2619 [Paenarthrobacter nicotinovorans]